ncbi:MAG: glycosyltransferase family 2 protein, partial [Peptococcaceae bacterium]|nr:glycosyltransferase family 2 protein [Peptococcaceae bacterium]
MRISACWITKNEEKNIALSINSVKAIADELIVVDTGSTDGTVQIARDLGARIETFAWIGDFSAARNYALSFASGDIFFFLDADEYFSPAMAPEDLPFLAAAFQARNADVIRTRFVDLDQTTGKGKGATSAVRIFSNRKGLRYYNKIHEMARLPGGASPKTILLNQWTIYHTGYSSSLIPEKVRRNIELLEKSLEAETDPFERFLLQGYLCREYKILDQPEKAMGYFLDTLRRGEYYEPACGRFDHTFLDRVVHALEMSVRFRDRVSREQIRRQLIAPIKEHYFRDIPPQLMDFYFQFFFAPRAHPFLEEYDLYRQNRDEKKEIGPCHTKVVYALNRWAAREHWLRDDKEKAFDYAAAALMEDAYFSREMFDIMLGCVAGQTLADTVLFFNSILDFSFTPLLIYIKDGLRRQGYRDVYLYYQKKLLDRGDADLTDFLYLLILNGQYELVPKAALPVWQKYPTSRNDIAALLLVNAVSAGGPVDAAEDQEYRRERPGYDRVLTAWLAGVPLAEVTGADLDLLATTYPLIVFAQDLTAAEKFRRVFAAAGKESAYIKIEYCLRQGLYGALDQDDRAGLSRGAADAKSWLALAEAGIHLGQYEDALLILTGQIEANALSDDLFRLLDAIREAESPVRRRADDLYQEYIALYDEIIDLRDLRRSDYREESGRDRQLKAYRKLRPAELSQILRREKTAAAPPELRELLAQVAEADEEKGL